MLLGGVCAFCIKLTAEEFWLSRLPRIYANSAYYQRGRQILNCHLFQIHHAYILLISMRKINQYRRQEVSETGDNSIFAHGGNIHKKMFSISDSSRV